MQLIISHSLKIRWTDIHVFLEVHLLPFPLYQMNAFLGHTFNIAHFSPLFSHTSLCCAPLMPSFVCTFGTFYTHRHPHFSIFVKTFLETPETDEHMNLTCQDHALCSFGSEPVVLNLFYGKLPRLWQCTAVRLPE